MWHIHPSTSIHWGYAHCFRHSPICCNSSSPLAVMLSPCSRPKEACDVLSAFAGLQAPVIHRKSFGTCRNDQRAWFHPMSMLSSWPNSQRRLKWEERVCQWTQRPTLASGNLLHDLWKKSVPSLILSTAHISPFQKLFISLFFFFLLATLGKGPSPTELGGMIWFMTAEK